MPGVPPVRGETFTFYCALTSQADTDVFQVNPTLAVGDVRVSIDGGALNNITVLPTVTPAGGEQVEVSLSIAEMNGDAITVLFSDVAGNEWQDLFIVIFTDTQQIGDLATAATAAAAVWAAGVRTLTSFGTLVADTAAAVWAYATRTLTLSAAYVAAAVSGSTIAAKSYTTWIFDISGIGNITDRTRLYFTVKRDLEADPDSDSTCQIEEIAGLLFMDAAPAVNPLHGSIAVTDAVAGDLTITVNAAVTGIGRRTLTRWGVKRINAAGVVIAMAEGAFTCDAPPTKAVT